MLLILKLKVRLDKKKSSFSYDRIQGNALRNVKGNILIFSPKSAISKENANLLGKGQM